MLALMGYVGDNKNKDNLVFFKINTFSSKLDELDKLDRVTHARIGFNYSLTQAHKTV